MKGFLADLIICLMAVGAALALKAALDALLKVLS